MVSKEDDIDPETLQAQIDMSMSFAHSLATSWIQTGNVARHSGITDMERMLHEELRRPPRLGVGAPIPASTSMDRDTSKLRHRLTKPAGIITSSSEAPLRSELKSDDEEEAKGKSMKRSRKIDPFERGHGKRRKVDNSTKIHNHMISGKDGKVALKEVTRKVSPSINNKPATPVKTAMNATAGDSLQRSDSPSPPKAVRICTQDSNDTSMDALVPSANPAIPVPKSALTPYAQRLGDCPSLSRVSGQHSVASKQASVSLLNLDGPPEVSEQVGNPGSPIISKKQRRRRKKKKKVIGTGTGTESTEHPR
ncbi:hypothetical protein V8B97DRAFT_1924035 [Scleroderma yunnanense]